MSRGVTFFPGEHTEAAAEAADNNNRQKWSLVTTHDVWEWNVIHLIDDDVLEL